MKVAVTGGTGLIGSALVPALREDGHQVLLISRGGGEERVSWDPGRGQLDASALAGCEAIIHLAGENVARRWDAETKRAILESRVQGTRLLVEAAGRLEPRPKVFLSASAIGYYGSQRKETVDEHSDSGEGFLAEVCRAWEAESDRAAALRIRLVKVRIGVVLAAGGGALGKLVPIFRAGLGGPAGSGRQRVSWIALADLVNLFRFALAEDGVDGVLNGVAPGVVTNRELADTLGQVLGRPALIPAPAMALRLAFGQMAEETVLSDVAVAPTRPLAYGFAFQHPELRSALEAVLK